MRLRESARDRASRSSAEILGGRYRLDGLLGSGGAADVHRGFDLRLRRPVAVKVFRSGTGFDDEEALHGEAVILARLDHPGLVTAYDAGRHDGRAFLIMQLVEGTTLRNLIAEGPLPPGATAAIGADLSRALAHAHEVGIVHRDVKPSNILLDGSRRPYLTDFGISRLLDATTRTATGTLIGTAAYLSPEQVLGQPVGRPADVYALGLVLLECLTGRLEYDGGPLEAAIARLHRAPVVPSSLPEELAALLRDMTALDEQARPTAHECARVLAKTAGAPAGAGVLPFPAAPPEPATSLVVPHQPRTSRELGEPREPHGASRTAGRTHRSPLPLTDTDHPVPVPAPASPSAPSAPASSAPRSGPARSRVLMAGATAALAVVMATAFALTDDSAQQGTDRNATRTTDSPSARTDSPDSDSDSDTGAGSGSGSDSGEKEAAAASSPTSPSDQGASTGILSGDAGPGAGSASPGPDHRSADDATTVQPAPSGTDALSATAQESATGKQTHQPPGRVKKSENAAKKAEEAAEKAQQGKPGKTTTTE